MSHIAFTPDYPIIAALLACAIMPLLLVLLSRSRLGLVSGVARMGGSVALSVLAWIALLMAHPALLGDGAASPGDVAAGLLLIATAALAVYSAWALIAYGYTISMLVDIARERRPQTSSEWAAAYAQGKGLRAMFEDRLRVVLGFGLVRTRGDDVRLSGVCARTFAALTRLLMRSLLGPRS